jgi:methyl-accepting chemotaxis protein
MQDIALATTEQESGINQLGQAISDMDNMTQQNAALVEEAAAASEAMREQAQQLEQVVSVFQLEQDASVRAMPRRAGAKARGLALAA